LQRHGHDNLRLDARDGRLYFGTDPSVVCDWCGSLRDIGECDCCPYCWAETEKREREKWEAIRRDAIFDSFVPTQFH